MVNLEWCGFQSFRNFPGEIRNCFVYVRQVAYSTLRSGGFKKQGSYTEACLGTAGQVDLCPTLGNLQSLFRGLSCSVILSVPLVSTPCPPSFSPLEWLQLWDLSTEGSFQGQRLGVRVLQLPDESCGSTGGHVFSMTTPSGWERLEI